MHKFICFSWNQDSSFPESSTKKYYIFKAYDKQLKTEPMCNPVMQQENSASNKDFQAWNIFSEN